jgi:LacI family transcriptional regulator
MADEQNGKTITQDDVAERAGVSRSIVSYVINNGPRKVSVETRNRVLAAIKELGYRPNKHAQMLSAPEESFAEKYIGIILAGNYMFKRPYYGSILESLHICAHEKDWHIRFIRVFDDFSNPALFNELIHSNEIGAVILIGLDQAISSQEDWALVEQIVQRIERVVCIEWEWPGVPAILFDRQDAAYRATQHLLVGGRTHIGYIGPDDKRVQGYRQALWENGIAPDSRHIYVDVVESRTAHPACEALLKTGLTLDAICVGTDEASVGVLYCLHQHGLRVPQDVAVASIDNLDISAFTIPALTTIDIPTYEIGHHAIEALIANPPRRDGSAFAITVRTQLIVRDSTMPAEA